VDIVADPDLEGPVEDVEEFVLARVDVRRWPAAGGGEVLEQHEASAGALARRLEGHRVADDPDPLALARGDGVAAVGGCVSCGHGEIVLGPWHQHHFISYCN
jgi:hypothetical protein